MENRSTAPREGDSTIGFELFRGALKELGDFRKTLGADIDPEAFREAVAERVAAGGLPLAAFILRLKEGEGEGAEYLREWLHKLVDGVFEGHDDLTLGGAIRRVDERAGLTKFALQLIDELASEKRGVSVPDLLDGPSGIVNIPLGEGWRLPVLVTIATPFTNRKRWLRRVSFAFWCKFAPMAQMKPESLLEAARAIPGWSAGKESRDIADELYEEEGYYETIPADSETERLSLYKRAVAKRAARLRKRKQSSIEAVKKVMGPTSQE